MGVGTGTSRHFYRNQFVACVPRVREGQPAINTAVCQRFIARSRMIHHPTTTRTQGQGERTVAGSIQEKQTSAFRPQHNLFVP